MDTKTRVLRADLLLLLTAGIWGFAFVAQRVGTEHVGPFTFTAVRFALGSLSLLPLVPVQRARRMGYRGALQRGSARDMLLGGGLAGIVLFIGVSLQQLGVMRTTASKAGFITGLYVVIVPLLGLFWRQQPGTGTWVGAALAAAGLYLLSVTSSLTLSAGDLLTLTGAVFWAIHVHVIGWLSPRTDPARLALMQFTVCSALSCAVAIATEPIAFSGLRGALIPILYGGPISVGVAYTLQIVGQRGARPARAAIILSLETVFAAVGGWLLLGETLSRRALLGCALMLAGMVLSQINIGRNRNGLMRDRRGGTQGLA